MKRQVAGALAMVVFLVSGCTRSGSTVNQANMTQPCPYAGAVVDAIYPEESDLAIIRDVFSSLGWKQTNIGVHEVINGTLDGTMLSALVSGGKMMLSVHVLRSHTDADYPKEDEEAEALLRRVRAPVEEALGLAPVDTFVHRINRGCEG